MAQILNDWPGSDTGVRSYPWDEWMDGKVRLLLKGEDYTCTTQAMRSQVGMKAKALGITYRTKSATDPEGLYVETILV